MSGRGQSTNVSQGSQVSTPSITCNFCGKLNHTEDECWKKAGKCFRCGSTEHQLFACARVYTINQQQVPDPTENVKGATPVLFNEILVASDTFHLTVNPASLYGVNIDPVRVLYDLGV